MSRPKPIVLLTHTNSKTYKSEQVLAGGAIYAVYYDGKPMNLRSLNSLVNYPGPKYKKVAYISSGSAFNLAEKLNALYKTDKFCVFKLTQGVRIVENKDGFDEVED